MNTLLQKGFLLFDDMLQCTDAEVERLLPLVSAQRREVALRFKFTFGRFTCLKSYVMLQQLVQEILAETDERWLLLQQRLKEWNGNFVFNEHDKPFMQNALGERIEGIDFSISHCKNAIAVVLSDRPVVSSRRECIASAHYEPRRARGSAHRCRPCRSLHPFLDPQGSCAETARHRTGG